MVRSKNSYVAVINRCEQQFSMPNSVCKSYRKLSSKSGKHVSTELS